MKEKIAVIGTGVAGKGIAQVFASQGYKIILKSRTQDALDKAIEQILLKVRIIDEKNKIIDNIKTTTKLDDLKEANIVIEAIVEDLATKQQLFKEMDDVLPNETIFVTNTSSLSVDELAFRSDRFIGMHFFNPVPKMQLVEVVRGKNTSDTTVNKIEELAKQVGKKPIILKNSPCFIVNRIMAVSLNEAIWELHEGIASVKDIDSAITSGLNHPMGPLALLDLIGLDVVLAILNNLYKATNNEKYLPCPLLQKMVHENQLGRKTKGGFYQYTR